MGYTVQTTTDTFNKLHEDRLNKYKASCPAFALFYYNSGWDHGVRIEAPEIMREFVDKVTFGRDPEGTLFFDDIRAFKDKTVYYNVFYNTGTVDTQRAVVVQFYIKTQGNFFAEFVGKDIGRNVAYCLDSQQGNWKPLNTGTANAHVEKDGSESTITVTIDAIDRQISFDVQDNSARTTLDVWGTILFKTLKNIPPGLRSIVNYNNDRIMFYPANGQTDLTAVFIPEETTAADATALGNFNWVSSTQDAVWSTVPE